MRSYSTEPEPIPAREPGYYWIQTSTTVPEVAHYECFTVMDQLLVDGHFTHKEIVSGYGWVFSGSDEPFGEEGVLVLSPRLVPPCVATSE